MYKIAAFSTSVLAFSGRFYTADVARRERRDSRQAHTHAVAALIPRGFGVRVEGLGGIGVIWWPYWQVGSCVIGISSIQG
jgi:hypothetical protein